MSEMTQEFFFQLPGILVNFQECVMAAKSCNKTEINESHKNGQDLDEDPSQIFKVSWLVSSSFKVNYHHCIFQLQHLLGEKNLIALSS